MSPTSNSPEKLNIKQGADGKNSVSTAAMVSTEFYNFVADIEDLIKESNLLTGEELAKAKSALNKRITAAKISMDGVSKSVSHRAERTAAMANTYVHNKPWPVIGVVSAVGFLLGYLLARRR
ncbi:hypothetical protein R50072_21660 [Simiduia litorea]|uniref:DUF883 family protein n=1 Tax=Simiduia litorea TaxID=1435348 RepID=UPI0036F23210